MYHHNIPDAGRQVPVEHRGFLIVAERVVRVQTQHVGEALWVATGLVSEPLPSGRRLKSPVEVTATGYTKEQAVDALKMRVEAFDHGDP